MEGRRCQEGARGGEGKCQGRKLRGGGALSSPPPPSSPPKALLYSDLTSVGSVSQMLGSLPTLRALPSPEDRFLPLPSGNVPEYHPFPEISSFLR